MNAMEHIPALKLVPVIRLDRAEDALPLGQALSRNGLPVAEVTFRTEAAEAAIRAMVQGCPDVLVGAGTITNVEQAKRAQGAGAGFIVSPGFSASVADFCRREGLPFFPGACTPTELIALLDHGLTVAKFFPAEQYGGLKTIKALSAPFPQMRFMPTGGVSEQNVLDYLAFDKIIACGGSWMVPDKLIRAGDFAAVGELVRSAVALVRGA